MKRVISSVFGLALVGLGATAAHAQQFRTSVVAEGLSRPVGIAVDGSEDLYFTEVPNPGMPASGNSVSHLDLTERRITRISTGEPEPTHIAVARNGDVYWTCKSAGVILRRVEESGLREVFAAGLSAPSGISIDRSGGVYVTEVPSPGVAGAGNKVSVLRGNGKTVISMGEPEPTDVVVARNGDVYWTCKAGGVILRRSQGVTSVFASGLESPSGIAIDHRDEALYFTEVPTPGVPGSAGGRNKVRTIDLVARTVETIHDGDPEPTDVAVARNGNVYWTCTSAGVIVEAKRIGRR
jgi:glucose/arabinose dehydrogenase